jgi:hypothetical protein
MVLNGNSSAESAFTDGFPHVVTTCQPDHADRRSSAPPSGANTAGSR